MLLPFGKFPEVTARAGYVEALVSWAVALVELERVTGQPIERILAPLEIRENQSTGIDCPPSPG